jgi:hypothetical protein
MEACKFLLKQFFYVTENNNLRFALFDVNVIDIIIIIVLEFVHTQPLGRVPLLVWEHKDAYQIAVRSMHV